MEINNCLCPRKDGYYLSDNEKTAAQIKRVLEFASMDAAFLAKLKETPESALQKIRVDIPFEKMKCLLAGNGQDMPLTEEAACYRQFVENKLKARNYMQQKGCVPSDPRFKKWRERQINRCRVEMGMRNQVMIHAPLMFELTEGCSVGCPFCGVNAGKLKSIYRYTPENAKLFREILIFMKGLLQDAAGSGTCYYASEPLDNPDYEKFVGDYYEILGTIPQITTAAAMREPERTKRMLAGFQKKYRHIHRFSILSLEIFRAVMDYFTPEELLYVELLPQFEAAPSGHLARTGRNRGEEDENTYHTGTICCVSGVVVNMPKKEIRLLAPCGVDDRHPTGELVFARQSFTDIESFQKAVGEIMERYMGKTDYESAVSFYPYLDVGYTEGGIVLRSKGGYENRLNSNSMSQNIPAIAAKLIEEGGYGIGKIADILEEKHRVDYAHSYYMLEKWYQSGFLTMEIV